MSRLSEHRITGVDYAAHTPRAPLGAMGNIGDDAALAMPKKGGHRPETVSETAVREKAEAAERHAAAVAVAGLVLTHRCPVALDGGDSGLVAVLALMLPPRRPDGIWRTWRLWRRSHTLHVLRQLLLHLGLAEPAGPPPRPPQAAVDPPGTAQVRRAAEVYLAERGGGIDGLYERIAAQLGGPDVDVTRWTKNLLARCKAGGWLVAGGGHGGSIAGPKLLEARGEGER